MSSSLEIRVYQKEHLNDLLRIKQRNAGKDINDLDDRISDIVVKMEKEDVAWVEKVVGIKWDE